jgi:short-subunit dehydrogenase
VLTAQKKIIIIGATSGIGYEMASLYAQQNCLVGVTGRRPELLNNLKSTFPTNIITSCFDVTAPGAVEHLQTLVQEMGGLDLFIYNAGYGDPSIELLPEVEMLTTKTNVMGLVATMGFVFDFFAKQGYGHIVVTSSIAALRGNSWAPSYSASKAFMSNYAEGLSIKANKLNRNIHITDIKPGFIDTNMAQGNGRFWVASPAKAARQIVTAIHKKKRVAYITKRWWLIAQLMKLMPYAIYRRVA